MAAAGELRSACYTEAFAPNEPHQGAVLGGIRAVQVLHTDAKRYKLMRFAAGTAPDIGAYEAGQALPHYGPR